jgi:Kef-type K+ transport system membrane component KefB
MRRRAKHLASIVSLLCFGLMGTSTTAYAAGGGMSSLVHDIGMAVFLAGLLAVLVTRFKIPSIAGFIAAGIVVGPIGLRQVTDPANIDTIAELGFILLLFMIGLELNVRKIISSGKTIILTGLLQFPLTLLFGLGIMKLAIWTGLGGALLADSPHAAIYVGIVIAASSTLLVIKLFQENFELDTEPGRVALGMLIFQDVWAIIVIIIQPNLDEPKIGPILYSFLGIALLIILVALAGKYIVGRFFQWIAKAPELILLAAIAWCFAVVFFGLGLDTFTKALFGVNYHIAVGSGMGALIAGASIASLPHSTEIVGKVGVVTSFFVTLFFVGLGMSIPVPSGWTVPLLAVAIVIVALLARQVIFFPLLYFFGSDQRNAEVTSIRLGQISEFGLVIAFLGVQYGHVGPELSSAIILAFVITALMTPISYKRAYGLHKFLSPFLSAVGFREPPAQAEDEAEEYEIAILGFHRTASSFVCELARNHPALLARTLVVDFNVKLHDQIKRMGMTAVYGDLSNSDTLHHAGLESAKIVVCSIPDDLLRGIDNRQLASTVRSICPDAVIIANAVSIDDVTDIYEAGADYVYLARFEAAHSLDASVAAALDGRISEYRQSKEDTFGIPGERQEILR